MTSGCTCLACFSLIFSWFFVILVCYWPKSKAHTPMFVPSPAPNPDCEPTMNNVMDCLSFLKSDDDSKPDKYCCSAIETAATTNNGCLCAIMESDQLKEFRAKAMTIPSGCGMKSPFGQCDLPTSPTAPAPESPVPTQVPLKGSSRLHSPYPKPESIKISVSPPSVPKPSPVSSPSVPSPKQESSKTPAAPSPSVASTAPAPAPKKSLATLTAYPISISVIAISSILFAYFC